jgi:ribonuclease HI
MELRAVFEALRSTPADRAVVIETDSKYVIGCFTEWLPGWKRNGWKTSARKPVANQLALLEIDQLLHERDVTWRHVKGHSGHVLNEVCDLRARAAAVAIRAGKPVDVGPGVAD